ncbi:hypothetical protein NC651_027829 [Populus alba x Populus x berolinensis]|nr:hypothetical protein NC651_027829 [Populus alba x Populus x berolinensis]
MILSNHHMLLLSNFVLRSQRKLEYMEQKLMTRIRLL